MMQNKITPSLWFHNHDGKLNAVIDYYTTIFKDNFKASNPIPLGDTPSGNAEMCNIVLFENPYWIMSTAKVHQPFNDSFALIIHCNGQDEINYYWDYFTKEGKASMCGWCSDKFGLRWQIIPDNMGQLMAKPNARLVMSKQSKIIIEEYLK